MIEIENQPHQPQFDVWYMEKNHVTNFKVSTFKLFPETFSKTTAVN